MMDESAFYSSYDEDELMISRQIDNFFSSYPMAMIEDKLLNFGKLGQVMNNNPSNDWIFYDELYLMLTNLRKQQYRQSWAKQSLEFSFNEQTLVCLEGIVNLIKQAIPVGAIYNVSKSNITLDLIVVLEKSCTKSYHEFDHVIDLVMLGQQSGTCTVHNYGLLNTLIQKGHLFYHTACIRENIIYQKSTDELFTFHDPRVIAEAKVEAENQFKKGMAKAVNFYNGAQYYIKDKVNDMAMFMLQQACELTYRCLLSVLRGRDIKCHSPAVLRKHLKRFAPSVIGIFADSEEGELEYLQVLEDAYIKSRYHQNYTIDNELLLFLNGKVGMLQQRSIKLFKDKMAVLTQQISSYQELPPNSPILTDS